RRPTRFSQLSDATRTHHHQAGTELLAGCHPPSVPSAPPGPSGPVGPRLNAAAPHGRLALVSPNGPWGPSGPSGPVGPRLMNPGKNPWLTLHDNPMVPERGKGRGRAGRAA